MSKTQTGSRVSPGRPPLPAPAYRAAAPRRGRPWIWTAVLVLFLLLALGALVVVIVLLVVLGRRPEAAIGGKSAPAAVTAAVSPAPVPTPTEEAKPRAKYAEPPKADAKSPPAAPAPGEPSRLESVGLLTGVHLYETYLSIGLLADATESEVYSTEEAGKLLDGISSMMVRWRKNSVRSPKPPSRKRIGSPSSK